MDVLRQEILTAPRAAISASYWIVAVLTAVVRSWSFPPAKWFKMPGMPNPQHRIQFTLSGWVAIVGALAILAAVAVAIAFLAVGLFVFLLPALLVTPIVYYLRPKPRLNPRRDNVMSENPTHGATIIEGEFKIVGTGDNEGTTNSSRLPKS